MAWLLFATAGCARGNAEQSDASAPDSARPDASPDSRPADASAPDAGCMISAGATPVLGGSDDMAAYPAAQQLAPGAMLGSDAAAITWDASRFYVTVRSTAFASAYEPLHIYVEAAAGLGPAVPAQGKEYSGLVPALPFTPTHLIAVRRVSDAGTGGYDGVFVPSGGWSTRATALDTDVFASSSELSVQVPWAAIGGCPTALRLVVHVVHGVAGNEWKDLLPATHTPWQAPGGGYYEIDLTHAPAVDGWTLR